MFKYLSALSILLLLPFLSHASLKLDEARSAYQHLQIPRAESIYKDILQQKDSDRESQFEAFIGLARIRQLMGDTSATKSYLREAVILAPWKKLSKTEFPPSFLRLHEEVRKGELGESGSLAITTDPPFVVLKIDGIKVGYSPITIPEIPVGTYKIEASAQGYSKAANSVSIGKGGKRVLALNLQPETTKDLVALQKEELVEKKTFTPIKRPGNKRGENGSNSENILFSPWVWGSALIVIGGIAAFAFSQTGDDSAQQQGIVSISLP